MMIAGKKKADIVTCLLYVFVLFVILSGSSMYSAMDIKGITSDLFFMKCAVGLSILISLMLFFLLNNPIISYRNLTVAALIGIHCLIYIAITQYSISRFVTSFILPLYAFAFLCMMLRNIPDGYQKLIRIYCNIILMIALLSLFFYFFGTILRILPGSFWINYTKKNAPYTCRSYFGVYFEAQTQVIRGIRLVRNCGIFMEAPGFAFPLTISLLYELFNNQKPRRWVCAVLVLAGITSWSTKAIVTMSIVVLLHILINGENGKKYSEIIRYLLGPIVLVLAVIVIYAALHIKINENISSLLTRVDDLQASIHAWTDNIIFGNGYKNYDVIRQYFKYVTNDFTGITAGVAIILAQGGIWLLFMYLFAILSWIRNAGKKRKKAVLVFLFIFILYWFNSSMQYGATMYLVMAMGLIAPVDSKEYMKKELQYRAAGNH